MNFDTNLDINYGLYETPKFSDNEYPELSMDFVLPLDFMQKWERCSLTSDYLAQYQSYSFYLSHKIEVLLSTIINELVENAVKFSCDTNKLVTISIRHYKKYIQIESVNVTDEANKTKLLALIDLLKSNDDIEALFLKQLEASFMEESNNSGLGILSLIKGYKLELGIKIIPVSESCHTYRVHFQVLLPNSSK
jgi:hypothetical protein